MRILQSVAAHVKLLLDTPEHIWRLLERKRYLHAGWLFLLARIVYQELVRDGAEDEDDWTAHEINMLVRGLVYGLIAANTHEIYQEQFPLVQRQWDAVAPLRAQITYKATLSLRDSDASLEVHPFPYPSLNFSSTRSLGHLFDSSHFASPRIPAINGRTVRLPCTASKKFTCSPITKRKICTKRLFHE